MASTHKSADKTSAESCQCRHIYLGSPTPTPPIANGRKATKEPKLRQRCPDKDEPANPVTTSIDSLLNAWRKAILLDNSEDSSNNNSPNNQKRVYPVDSLQYCVQYVPVPDRAVLTKSQSKFRGSKHHSEPLIDSKNKSKVNGHLPMRYVVVSNRFAMQSMHPSIYSIPAVHAKGSNKQPIASRKAKVPIINSVMQKGKSKFINGNLPSSLRYTAFYGRKKVTFNV